MNSVSETNSPSFWGRLTNILNGAVQWVSDSVGSLLGKTLDSKFTEPTLFAVGTAAAATALLKKNDRVASIARITSYGTLILSTTVHIAKWNGSRLQTQQRNNDELLLGQMSKQLLQVRSHDAETTRTNTQLSSTARTLETLVCTLEAEKAGLKAQISSIEQTHLEQARARIAAVPPPPASDVISRRRPMLETPATSIGSKNQLN